jgi:hypothetical protein
MLPNIARVFGKETETLKILVPDGTDATDEIGRDSGPSGRFEVPTLTPRCLQRNEESAAFSFPVE